MQRLGISIYPEHSTPEKDLVYMKLAAKYGFTRIFTCLLSVKESKEDIIKNFTEFVKNAHELGFIVSVDTSPVVFKYLGATPTDLSVFHQMNVDIIRLDGSFDEFENIAITRNPYNIKIEYNGSSNMSLDLLIERGANKHNMCICSNFYPQKNTGMSVDRFKYFNEKYQPLGLTNAAFVSSNEKNTFGPWEVYAGLPTLEIHRNLPIDLQTRYLFATRLIDDVLVGNAYASEEELKAMSEVDLTKVTLKIDFEEGVTDFEKEDLFSNYHMVRTDGNDIVLRSSFPRIIYKGREVPERKHNREKFTRGDVIIVNDNLKHYRAEIMVVLQDIEATNEYNLIGHLSKGEELLLDYIKQDFQFGFIKE